MREGGRLSFRFKLLLSIRIEPKDNGSGDLKQLWIMSHYKCSHYEDASNLLRAASKSQLRKNVGAVATLFIVMQGCMATAPISHELMMERGVPDRED